MNRRLGIAFLLVIAFVMIMSGAGSAYGADAATGLEPDNQFFRVAMAGSSQTAIAAGTAHTCALTTAGGVKCWGNNAYGQLGDGTTTNRLTPVDVSGLSSGVSAVSAGRLHTCALTAAGGAKCWGLNDSGQLGDGTTTNRLMPVDVSGLSSGVIAISASAGGGTHTCALTTAGGVKCWGSNGGGQLGDGGYSGSYSPTPVNVAGLASGVSAIAAGGYHTCVLTTDGGVKCWGWNSYGQLGDGTTTDHSTPVNVSGLASGVSALGAGALHNCAVTASGGVKCWGSNMGGALGDGGYISYSPTPVNVSGLSSGVSTVSSGGYYGAMYYTCVLTAAGGVKCWGDNSVGELGDGTTTGRPTPVVVSGLSSGVSAVSAGGGQTCALTIAGGVKCWGLNDYGQVGDGTYRTFRLTPVDVVGLGGETAYTISGQVLDQSGAGVFGVLVCTQDNVCATSDANGTYDISNLPAGSYTVTATKAGYTFLPTSRSMTLPPNASGVDFSAALSSCADAGANLQPLMLVHGWGAPDFLDGDTMGFAAVKDYLSDRHWIEGCNLFYAQGIFSTGSDFRERNRISLSVDMHQAYDAVKVWNPDWNGHFDIIGHSYGGLNARFYLESDYYRNDRDRYGIQVDNLFTLGSPHGGTNLLLENYPGAAYIGLSHLVPGNEAPSALWLLDGAMAAYNLGARQPSEVCYRLIGGDFLRQSSIILKAPVVYGLYLLRPQWNLPNDIGVSQRSSLNLGKSTLLQLSGRYPFVVTHSNKDMHGYTDRLGDVESYVRTSERYSATFDNYITPVTAYPAIHTASNLIRCYQDIMAENTAISENFDASAAETGEVDSPSPVLVAADVIAGGQTLEYSHAIDWAGSTAFYVTAAGVGIELTLEDPNGRVITPESLAQDDNVNYDQLLMNDTTLATYIVADGVAGPWQIALSNSGATEAAFEIYVIPPDDASIILTSNVPAQSIAGVPVQVSTTLTNIDLLDSGVTVTATVYEPGGNTVVIPLADDGQPPDVTASDAVYSGMITDTGLPGIYRVVFSATGSIAGVPFERSLQEAFTAVPTAVTLSDIIDDRAVDDDVDGFNEYLEIDVVISSSESRTILLSAALYNATEDVLLDTATLVVKPSTGTQVLPLRFSGDAIRNAGEDGPYVVKDVVVKDDDLLAPMDEWNSLYTTSAYQSESFGFPMPPDIPTAVTPEDGDEGVAGSAVLIWGANDRNPYDSLSYEIRLGTATPPPQVVAGQSSTTYDPSGDLEPGTTYYWQIVATDDEGLATEGPVWSFTTTDAPNLYSISGNISEDIGFPMEGALIKDSSGAETYADENGDYVLTGLQAGVHEVEVFYNDYEFANNPVTVTLPPDAVDIDFVGTFVGLNVLLIEPMADAYVDEASKTVNFGTKPYLRVKNAATDNNTYLKFEVSGLSCAVIESVGLSLFTKDPGPDGGTVYSVANNWTETGINWNNAPPFDGAPLGSFDAVVDESWEHARLSNIAVTGDGIYSFAVRNNSSNLVEYSSREGTYPGWLQIEYRLLPAVVPSADFLADHTSGFSPLTVNFQDISTGCPTGWLWDFGDGTTSTAQHPSHEYAGPGTYEVSLTVSNAKGSDTETKIGYITINPTPPEPDYFISPSGSATIGGIPSTPADILRYDKATNQWTMVYDGSVRGTTKNISAFDILDDGSLLLVFSANQTIAGLGTATPYDVVKFTPNTPGVYPLGTGTFSWFFQGKPLGLTTSGEKIDAMHLSGNRLLLSTTGTAKIPLPPSGTLSAPDEDVFAFNMTTSQWETALVIDGSLIPGMGGEDLASIWDDPDSGDYYITITGSFNLGGVKGNGKSIVKLTPNGGATVFTPSLVSWLAPGAMFPSNLDGLALRN